MLNCSENSTLGRRNEFKVEIKMEIILTRKIKLVSKEIVCKIKLKLEV